VNYFFIITKSINLQNSGIFFTKKEKVLLFEKMTSSIFLQYILEFIQSNSARLKTYLRNELSRQRFIHLKVHWTFPLAGTFIHPA